MPTTMPTVVDRMKAVAKNPVACTQFFQTWRRAMWSVLHGWPMDSDAQINHDCLFGKIRAGMDHVENSSRLALHDHAVLIQADLQPARLLQLQQVCLQQLDLFVSQLAAKHLPPGWFVQEPTGGGEWAALNDAQPALDFKQVDGRFSSEHEFPAPKHLLDTCIDDKSAAAAVAAAQEFVARAAAQMQVHAHSHRCRKGGRRGDDADCAAAKPEAIRPTTIVNDGGTMLFRCDHGMLVPYAPALLLGLPCNHMVALCCDAARWETTCTRAQAEGLDPPCDTPGSVTLAAAQAANYACKYITKKPQEADNTMDYLMAAHKCKPVAAFDAPDALSADLAAQGKSMVTRLINQINSKYIVPQALAAMYNLGFFMTHDTVAYYPFSFVRAMRDIVAPDMPLQVDDGKQVVVGPVVSDSHAAIVYASAVTDYSRRHDALRFVPVYFFLMLFDRAPLLRAADSEHGGASDGRSSLAEPGEDVVMAEAEPEQQHAPVQDGHMASDGRSSLARAPGARTEARTRLSFKTDHPQHLRQALVLRSKPKLPHAVQRFPDRPVDSAMQHARDLYALTMLSLFMSDTLLTDMCTTGYSLWDIFVCWESDACFDVVYVPTQANWPNPLLTVITHLRQAEYSLHEALDACVNMAQAAGVTIGDACAKWHMLGHHVVDNINSLSAAEEEDRQMAVAMRRSKLRRAAAAQGDVGQVDSDGDGDEAVSDPDAAASDNNDDDADIVYEQDDSFVFDDSISASQLPVGNDAFLAAMLAAPTEQPTNSRELAKHKYLTHALHNLPAVDFGQCATQRPTATHTTSTSHFDRADVC